MTDLSVFAEPAFDPKAWINAACAGRAADEPLERFLAELEMRLQVRRFLKRVRRNACAGPASLDTVNTLYLSFPISGVLLLQQMPACLCHTCCAGKMLKADQIRAGHSGQLV